MEFLKIYLQKFSDGSIRKVLKTMANFGGFTFHIVHLITFLGPFPPVDYISFKLALLLFTSALHNTMTASLSVDICLMLSLLIWGKMPHLSFLISSFCFSWFSFTGLFKCEHDCISSAFSSFSKSK